MPITVFAGIHHNAAVESRAWRCHAAVFQSRNNVGAPNGGGSSRKLKSSPAGLLGLPSRAALVASGKSPNATQSRSIGVRLANFLRQIGNDPAAQLMRS